MWPFKQRKTIPVTMDLYTGAFKTADGHHLDEIVVCVRCHRLVEAAVAVTTKTIYDTLLSPTVEQHRWIEDSKEYEEQHCPDCAPKWDVVVVRVRRNEGQTIRHYRRIPAVPERLEEIVEAPVRVTRKRKSKRGAN